MGSLADAIGILFKIVEIQVYLLNFNIVRYFDGFLEVLLTKLQCHICWENIK